MMIRNVAETLSLLLLCEVMVEVMSTWGVGRVAQASEFVFRFKKELVLVKTGRGTAVEPEGSREYLRLSVIWLLP